MFSVAKDWNPKQMLLKQVLKEGNMEETRKILCELHSAVHTSKINGKHHVSYMDEIMEGLPEKAIRVMPTIKDVTIAWNIWHITRIEDITANILITNSKQVLNNEWLSKLNTDVKDTGNAMTPEEIVSFSNELNISELISYRNSVGIRTRRIIENLKKEDLKRKFGQAQLDRILNEGGVIKHQESIWLLDFWGKKTVAGILMMPITRHQIVHLNDCKRLKAKFSKII